MMTKSQRTEPWQIVAYVVACLVVGTGIAAFEWYADNADDGFHPAEPPAAPVGEVNCPHEMSALAVDASQRASCWCDGETAHYQLAWGTAQYHYASTPCAAAIHAGAVSRGGGARVTFQRTRACRAYMGTTFHYETTQSHDNYRNDPSYIVVGHGAPGCSQSFNDEMRAEAL